MDIKILGVSASPVKNSNTDEFLKVSLDAAAKMGDDVKTDMISLAGKKFQGCIHCHWCEDKQEAGKPPCNLKDDLLPLWPQIMEADGYIFSTPVYGSNPSWSMCAFMDRWRCMAHSNYYQGIQQDKVAGNLAVLWFRHAGGETCLTSMLWRVLTSGMIPACGFGSRKYGAIGLTTPEGTGVLPEKNDDKHLVLKDKIGCQSARIIGRRVVYLARIMKPVRMAANAARVRHDVVSTKFV